MGRSAQQKNSADDKKISRILWLKIHFGDDFIDYIKDDYGVERFIQDIFNEQKKKNIYLKRDPEVKKFVANWLVFTDYYKNRFGRKIRDKDAIEKLSKESVFRELPNLYSFRCKLFKADFSASDDFGAELQKNLLLLKRMNKVVARKRQIINKYMIKNTEW